MDRIWKQISLTPHYEVSNDGMIRNKETKKVLKGSPDKDGYLRVCLKLGLEKHKTPFIHRLVAQAFLQNPNNFLEVNHKDENKQNNNVDNLEWCTREYNYNYGSCKDRLKKSNQEKNGKKVKAIKDNKEYHFCSVKEASRILEIDKSNIFACLKGRLKTTKGYRFEVV